MHHPPFPSFTWRLSLMMKKRMFQNGRSWPITFIHQSLHHIKGGREQNHLHTILSTVFRRAAKHPQSSKNEIRKLFLYFKSYSNRLLIIAYILTWRSVRSSQSLSWPWPSPHLKEIRNPSKLCHPTAKWTPMEATPSSKFTPIQLSLILILIISL